ncbi:MAG: hypothetical protein IKA32_11740 [Lentisphaeria bacterium]|nr:hypothetical protein [Lentisphaeria bacterium]
MSSEEKLFFNELCNFFGFCAVCNKIRAVPDKGRWEPGKGEKLFSREKAGMSAPVYFCFLLVRRSLVRRRIRFSKKAAYFAKWNAAFCWRLSTRTLLLFFAWLNSFLKNLIHKARRRKTGADVPPPQLLLCTELES